MARRIFISCPANHDEITIAHLACVETIGRKYDPAKDFLRYVGQSDPTQSPRKCQVLVDCNVNDDISPTYVELTCYTGSGDSDVLLTRMNSIPYLSRLRKEYAWGKRGPAVQFDGDRSTFHATSNGLFQKGRN